MTKIVESGYLNFIVSKVLKVSTSYSILSYLPFLRKTYFLLWPGWDVSRGWVGAGERLSAIAGDHPLFVLLFVIVNLKQILSGVLSGHWYKSIADEHHHRSNWLVRFPEPLLQWVGETDEQLICNLSTSSWKNKSRSLTHMFWRFSYCNNSSKQRSSISFFLTMSLLTFSF